MANTKGIRAGKAYVELFADNSKLVQGLRLAQRKIMAFGNTIRNMGLKLAGIGAALAAPFVMASKSFSSMGDQVAKMAKRTGLSVETLSELKFVASQTGTEFVSLENAFRRMQRSVYDAGRGLSTSVDALSDLNLQFQDLDGLSPEDQFKLLGDRISQITDPTRQAAIAMTLFGRTGTNLLPMFANGAKGIEELQKQARQLGLTMTSEDAAAAEVFTDTMDKLNKVVKMAVFHIGSALAGAFNDSVDHIVHLVKSISDWIKQNKGLVVTFAKIIGMLTLTGVSLAVLGMLISATGAAFGVLATIASAVSAAFGVVAAAISAIISPIGLAITAVVALGGYLLFTSQTGAKALAWLGDRFGVLAKTATQTFRGIGDALAAGDVVLAARILWLSLKLTWRQGVNALKKVWYNLQTWMTETFYTIVEAAQLAWHGLEVAWIETTSFFSRAWNKFVSFFAKSWERIKAGAKKAWNWIKSLFDDTLDLETENKLVDEERQKAIAKIEDDQQTKLAQLQAERQKKRDAAAAKNAAILAGIEDEAAAKLTEMDADHAAKIAANEAELARAKSKWKEAIKSARDKRNGLDDKSPELDATESAKDLKSALAGVSDVIGSQMASVSITGTFSAFAAGGLGSGNAMDRTAQATEETARNTKQILNISKFAGGRFS
ncbi:phage tail tape measure protein, TP901 family, core region [Anaerohalosphaera lusitana]|uniref:Phage tail tape measure protein, TP901 family, core region n=1 Tax=Anaerohalosphaera lusitana TaxID=1936003 RepID=A0A1U9NJ42_9BACT|nr:phage tail tape measure protein [Anaerohalosphaera lusitana]AQT67953.1 phage tail tape measure protein, TP901 family, core region [Anaerohalosphaera lusitana]